MAVELVDCLAILVAVRRFPCMGVADIYVRVHHFFRRKTYVPFRRIWGDVRREFMQRLFAALGGTLGSFRGTFVMLCRRAMLMLWHAFLFLGLRFFSSFLLFAWWLMLLFLVRNLVSH
jgi:hypothetical protein